jgi:hypothetical protein
MNAAAELAAVVEAAALAVVAVLGAALEAAVVAPLI